MHNRIEKEGEAITFSREFARQFVRILIVEDFEPYRAYELGPFEVINKDSKLEGCR